MLSKRFALLLALLTVFSVSLPAHENSDADNSAGLKLALESLQNLGEGSAGSRNYFLRAIQTSSGKAWVSWTDENGKFEFPALPTGHYRVEISQLGFAPAHARDHDACPASRSVLSNLKLDVGTLAAASMLLRHPTTPQKRDKPVPRFHRKPPKPLPPALLLRILERRLRKIKILRRQIARLQVEREAGGAEDARQQGKRDPAARARGAPGGPGQGAGRRSFSSTSWLERAEPE